MLDGDYQVVISCIDAALQYTIPPDELRSKRLTLRAGQEAPLEKIEALLSASGYERYQQVEGPGQFAVRGGILDFFTPDAPRLSGWSSGGTRSIPCAISIRKPSGGPTTLWRKSLWLRPRRCWFPAREAWRKK